MKRETDLKDRTMFCSIIAEPRQRSTIGKQIWELIDARNFGCDVTLRTYARLYRLWGRWKGVPTHPNGGRRMPSFLGRKSRGAFLTTSAAKRLFDSVEVLNLRKSSNISVWKKGKSWLGLVEENNR